MESLYIDYYSKTVFHDYYVTYMYMDENFIDIDNISYRSITNITVTVSATDWI